MHLAFLCEEYPPARHGGTGSSYRDLAEGLVAAGHGATNIGISTTLPIERTTVETINGVRVVRIPRAPRWMGARLGGWWERARLLARVRRENEVTPFDAVEASDYNGWLSSGGLRGVPNVVRIRGSNLFFDAELGRAGQPFEHRHERAALANATHLASVSRYAAERTLALAGLAERECTVIPNGVDAEYFSPDAAVAAERGLIVYVNTVTPRKGIEQLILAVNEVFPSRPGARLVVIGRDPRGEEHGFREQLTALLKPEVRDRVEWKGRQPRDEVRAWLRRASICCYPSHMETFGIAPIEAMSVGKATIFTKLGPGPEIIADGEDGLLCDPREPADIARCLGRFLDDSAFAARVAESAREKVLRAFDKRSWVGRNVEFYERCASGVSGEMA